MDDTSVLNRIEHKVDRANAMLDGILMLLQAFAMTPAEQAAVQKATSDLKASETATQAALAAAPKE